MILADEILPAASPSILSKDDWIFGSPPPRDAFSGPCSHWTPCTTDRRPCAIWRENYRSRSGSWIASRSGSKSARSLKASGRSLESKESVSAPTTSRAALIKPAPRNLALHLWSLQTPAILTRSRKRLARSFHLAGPPSHSLKAFRGRAIALLDIVHAANELCVLMCSNGWRHHSRGVRRRSYTGPAGRVKSSKVGRVCRHWGNDVAHRMFGGTIRFDFCDRWASKACK